MCNDRNAGGPIPLWPDGDGGGDCTGSDCRITVVTVKEAQVIAFSFGRSCHPDQQEKLLHLAQQRLKSETGRVFGSCPDDCYCVPFGDATFRETDPVEIHVRPFLIVDPHDPNCFIAVEKASVTLVVSVIDGLCVPLQIEGPGSLLGPDGTIRVERPQAFPSGIIRRISDALA